ncbi:hypothetical protein [Paenibacillus caui]|uniref:hypothetical protein n=1 Tax=Paenibacillus caui TaxID=2873927 RepID=UPI001CAA27F6|nr:hypothetical protein [Paenibacillus caui]
MGKFNIQINKASKIMNISVEGNFSPADGKASIEAYYHSVADISIPEYTIDIDCTRLEFSAPDSLPHLGHCFELYKNGGFKKVIFRISENPILKMQLTGVARMTELTDCEIIE